MSRACFSHWASPQVKCPWCLCWVREDLGLAGLEVEVSQPDRPLTHTCPLPAGAEKRMEKNAVAAFLLMLRNFPGPTRNQEAWHAVAPGCHHRALRTEPCWGRRGLILTKGLLVGDSCAMQPAREGLLGEGI